MQIIIWKEEKHHFNEWKLRKMKVLHFRSCGTISYLRPQYFLYSFLFVCFNKLLGYNDNEEDTKENDMEEEESNYEYEDNRSSVGNDDENDDALDQDSVNENSANYQNGENSGGKRIN